MTSPPLSPPPGVESVEVHWGTVGHEVPPPPAPPREGRRRRLGLLAAVAVTALAVALGGGLLLVQEDHGAETVAGDYVAALQRLDCDEMEALAADRLGGTAQCRILRYRSARQGDDVRTRLRESRFRLADVRESGRDATARFEVSAGDGDFGDDTAQMFVRMRRDENAEWRVLSSSFVQSGR